jgi:hypothetical protein
MLCMPPIDWADNVAGAASIATMTANPILILRSMTILRVVTPRHSENATERKMFK